MLFSFFSPSSHNTLTMIRPKRPHRFLYTATQFGSISAITRRISPRRSMSRFSSETPTHTPITPVRFPEGTKVCRNSAKRRERRGREGCLARTDCDNSCQQRRVSEVEGRRNSGLGMAGEASVVKVVGRGSSERVGGSCFRSWRS